MGARTLLLTLCVLVWPGPVRLCDWNQTVAPDQGLDPVSLQSGAFYLNTEQPVSGPDQCREACCSRSDCDLALVGYPQDGDAHCFLVHCFNGGRDVCALQSSSQFKVFKKVNPEDRNQVPDGPDGEVGSCRAAFPRFFYNVTDQTCRRFTYGGCDANSNNFETKEECESTCSGVTAECNTAVIQSERCKAELQVGPCRAAFQRWYFNSLTGRCQRFIYGGCKGNKNNYENEESCRSMCTVPKCFQTCSDTLVYIENCMVTSDPGPCRAAFPAFYYDHKTSTCRSFTYGGCRGNKNRYNTMEECTNRCSQGSERKRYGMVMMMMMMMIVIYNIYQSSVNLSGPITRALVLSELSSSRFCDVQLATETSQEVLF
uniref:Uncharacterized protein n=1 Tax=Sphaeramia orbicularis TaxID=375764 RepID=A0A673C7A5_9TELE